MDKEKILQAAVIVILSIGAFATIWMPSTESVARTVYVSPLGGGGGASWDDAMAFPPYIGPTYENTLMLLLRGTYDVPEVTIDAGDNFQLVASALGEGTQCIFVGSRWTIVSPNTLVDGSTNYGIKIRTRQDKGIILHSTANGTVLKNIEIEGVGDDGSATPSNDLIYSSPAPSGVSISRSYLHHCGRTMIKTNYARNWRLENSILHHNESTSGQHSEAWSAGAGDPDHGALVRNNYFFDIEGTGVIVAIGNDWLIEGNVVLNDAARAPYYNATFGTWSNEGTTTGWKIRHNTIITHNYVLGGPRHKPGVFMDGANGSYHEVRNNLFVGDTYTIVYNGIWRQGGTALYGQLTKGPFGVDPLMRLEDYPLFDRWYPKWSLPGDPNEGVLVDMDGRDRFIPSIGALEYQDPTPTPAPTLPPTPTHTFKPTATKIPLPTNTPIPPPTATPTERPTPKPTGERAVVKIPVTGSDGAGNAIDLMVTIEVQPTKTPPGDTDG